MLYICEPIGEHAKRRYASQGFWGYTEETAVRFFLNNIDVLGHKVSRIVVRPHPSEPRDKYRWLENEFRLPIVFGGAMTLIEEMYASDVVVGCESMALVVGLVAGKRVISCIPPGPRQCSLPQAGIEHLREMLNVRKD